MSGSINRHPPCGSAGQTTTGKHRWNIGQDVACPLATSIHCTAFCFAWNECITWSGTRSSHSRSKALPGLDPEIPFHKHRLTDYATTLGANVGALPIRRLFFTHQREIQRLHVQPTGLRHKQLVGPSRPQRMVRDLHRGRPDPGVQQQLLHKVVRGPYADPHEGQHEQREEPVGVLRDVALDRHEHQDRGNAVPDEKERRRRKQDPGTGVRHRQAERQADARAVRQIGIAGNRRISRVRRQRLADGVHVRGTLRHGRTPLGRCAHLQHGVDHATAADEHERHHDQHHHPESESRSVDRRRPSRRNGPPPGRPATESRAGTAREEQSFTQATDELRAGAPIAAFLFPQPERAAPRSRIPE